VSVPVSGRRTATAAHLGNEVGVIPIELPATGDPVQRLEAIARATREAKQTSSPASTAVLGPIFRVLARLGIFRWCTDRQRLVHTFVTNLRGPGARLSFLGAPITDVLAVAGITGNVTVSFAVLSYAGTLGITVIADPEACPDLDVLSDALQVELDRLAPKPATAR
jgi:diacylglycerol O-acyltransferase